MTDPRFDNPGCDGTYPSRAFHVPSPRTQAQGNISEGRSCESKDCSCRSVAEELAEAFEDAVGQIVQSPVSSIGADQIYSPQISTRTVKRWLAALERYQQERGA